MLRQYEAGHTCLLLGLSLPIAKRQSWQSRLMGRCSWLMWFCHISVSFRSAAVRAFILGTVVLSLNGGCPRWTLIATESKRFFNSGAHSARDLDSSILACSDVGQGRCTELSWTPFSSLTSWMLVTKVVGFFLLCPKAPWSTRTSMTSL